MKAIIVEDEAIAAERLEQLIKETDASIEVIAKIGSVKEAVIWFQSHKPDLIFLDIQLSDGLSFSIFEEVAISAPVIFTTAYDQYAIKAFKLNSVSYLLKPVRRSELEESLQKYHTLKNAFSIDFDMLFDSLQGKTHFKKRFLVQLGAKIRKIGVEEIAYFYALEKGVFLNTFQNQCYPLDYTLDKLENMLDPTAFFRINRKYIISMNAISNMVAYSRSRVKLDLEPPVRSGEDAIVSVDRSAAFKSWLDS